MSNQILLQQQTEINRLLTERLIGLEAVLEMLVLDYAKLITVVEGLSCKAVI